MIIGGNTLNYGGGISNSGTLTLDHSTILYNMASTGGAGIMNTSTGTLTITNSTIANNLTVSGPGNQDGGIYNEGSTATMTVINSTLYNSSVDSTGKGGGIYNTTSTTTLVISSTIANNTGADGDVSHAGTIINAQNSLIGNGLTNINGTNINNLMGNPLLGTFTGVYIPLNPSIIAIDVGDNSLVPGEVSTDQAGNLRIPEQHRGHRGI